MAASLSRPDPSSPASVAEAGFSTTRRGYHPDEVRAFLTSVAAELGRLQERERQLEARLEAAETEIAPTPDLDEEMVASIVGEETLRVLQTARESASQIKIRAEEAAARILNDANDEINRIRQETEVEAARRRHDATSDAEAEVALAKQQGREMVNEARAYRERVLADLERRTKVARSQIEELVHGRDRLLQVFERARLVAVDVTSELQSIDGPEEIVNFSPTTGPVPLMVPATNMDDAADDRPADSTDGESGPDDTAGDDIDDTAREAAADEEVVDEVAVDGVADDTTDDSTTDDSTTDDDTTDDSTTDDDTAAPVADVDADVDPDVDSAPSASGASVRDANVVSLFRDRTAADGAPAEAEAETDERPDVNGIFERLRAESPEAAEQPDEPEIDDAAAAGADETPTPFLRRDEVLTPLIVGAARKLKRVLADEQNGVLDRLRQKQAVTATDELLAGLDEHAAAYVDALADDLIEAAVAGAAEVGKRDTKTLRTTLRKSGALDGARTIVRDDLVDPLRERLARAIADGDGDNDAITKRVRAVYREWKTQHIDDQLDDAFRFAHGGGIATGVKPGTELVWTIDPSEPTCPDCEDNSLAGPVAAGEPFPTGHVSAPAHPGCRCLTVPTGQ